MSLKVLAIGSANDPAGPAPQAPAIPMLAAGRAAPSSYADHSQTTIHVTQQPGENGRDLARRIAEEQERRRAVQRRSAMHDGAVAN